MQVVRNVGPLRSTDEAESCLVRGGVSVASNFTRRAMIGTRLRSARPADSSRMQVVQDAGQLRSTDEADS
jgi:hypothetical protein